MEKAKSEDTKILFLEIDGLNKDFNCGKHATQIINTENTSSQVVFNNNDCFVHLSEVKDGFHISAECLYSNEKRAKNLVNFIENSLERKWKCMFDYFEKHHCFQDSDCKFYNYINGDFSRLSINKVGKNAVISYRLFVDNSGFNIEKAIKLGMYIIEVLQKAIMSIKDEECLTDFFNILIYNLFDKISFLDLYYEALFKELSDKNYNFSEMYYYHNKLSALYQDIKFDDVNLGDKIYEDDLRIVPCQTNNLPF